MDIISEQKKDFIFRFILSGFVRIFWAAIGVAVVAAWWCWLWPKLHWSLPKLFSQVPIFLGTTRFHLDIIGVVFFAPIIAFYVEDILNKYDKISDDGDTDGKRRISLKEFWYVYPKAVRLGIFLLFAFVTGLIFTLTVSVIIYLIWMIIRAAHSNSTFYLGGHSARDKHPEDEE